LRWVEVDIEPFDIPGVFRRFRRRSWQRREWNCFRRQLTWVVLRLRRKIGLPISRPPEKQRAEGADQTGDGSEQSDEQADIRERRKIMRALLDTRNDFEEALVHGLFDVVATTGARHAGDSIVQDGRDRGFRALRESDELFEVAGAQRGDEVIPQTAVANGFARQINVPLDGDRYADDEDQGQWVEEKPTVLEKIDAVSGFRDLIGATNPANAEEGTIRKKFGKSLSSNAIHGSDSDENANIEAHFFFSDSEMY